MNAEFAPRLASPESAAAPSSCPRVTLGFVSYNRLHYLRATLESARECIRYPNLEWIVSDGNSEEPGLRAYLEGCMWLDHCLFHERTHPEAMNKILALATGDFIIIWPEDVQFTVRGDWLADLVAIMSRHRWIGSMCLDYMRRATLEAIFRPRLWANRGRLLNELRRYGLGFRRQRTVYSARGLGVVSFGWMTQGVCGSGIPSLTRTEVWRRLGPWKTSRPQSVPLTDSSLGAEDDMVARFYRSRWPLQGATPLVPVAADIVTDPTGCKAKIRGPYRYGVYMPPPEGTYYYRIRDMAELAPPSTGLPVSFAEGVEPLGFTIPVDERGDRLKSSINLSVVHDRTKRTDIPYPLMIEKAP
jgi:hypothetical protein